MGDPKFQIVLFLQHFLHLYFLILDMLSLSGFVGSLIMCVAGLERIALGGFKLCKWIAHGPLD